MSRRVIRYVTIWNVPCTPWIWIIDSKISANTSLSVQIVYTNLNGMRRKDRFYSSERIEISKLMRLLYEYEYIILCWLLFTSKFLRAMKYCGVSGKKINNTKNRIGSGEKTFGTSEYVKYVPATKPNKIPIVTLSINNAPRRPRILQFILQF